VLPVGSGGVGAGVDVLGLPVGDALGALLADIDGPGVGDALTLGQGLDGVGLGWP
jgi:hypothetical protein